MDNLHGGGISMKQQKHNSDFFADLARWISAVGFAPALSIPAFSILVLTGGPVQYGVTPMLFVSILFGFLSSRSIIGMLLIMNMGEVPSGEKSSRVYCFFPFLDKIEN